MTDLPEVILLIIGKAGFQIQVGVMSKSVSINMVSPKDLSHKDVKSSRSGLSELRRDGTLLIVFIFPRAHPAPSQYTPALLGRAERGGRHM